MPNPNTVPKVIPQEMPEHRWVFPAYVMKIVDGDTIDVMVDKGMNEYRSIRLRMMGINAPETKGETKVAGDASTFHVKEWVATLADQKYPLRIQTFKSDDWGRYISVVWNVATGDNLNMEMLSSGNAVPFDAKRG